MQLPYSALSLMCVLYWASKASADITRRSTTTICATDYVSTSVVPTSVTSYRAVTSTITLTTTSTPPVVKIPGSLVIKSITRTTRTKVTITGSAPSTNTISTTTTFTTTQTLEAPTPTTIVTATETSSTISTPTVVAGPTFPAIGDTLPGAMKKRSRRVINARQDTTTPSLPASTAPGYPKNIKCNVVTRVAISVILSETAPAKTVTLSPKTTATTITITATITTTSYPPNTATTIISTETTTEMTTTTPATSTTTSTTTTTSTIIGIAATSYPACGPRNIASSYNGIPIVLSGSYITTKDANGNVKAQSFRDVYTSAPDAQSCCIACLNYPDCGANLFLPAGAPETRCMLSLAPDGYTCDPNKPFLNVLDLFTNSPYGVRYVSNGLCIQHTRVVDLAN